LISISKESDQSDSVIVINNQALITTTEPIAINDDLGVHVTKHLREQIINGEYIDLGLCWIKPVQNRLICLKLMLQVNW
jgi:hypothetical protein